MQQAHVRAEQQRQRTDQLESARPLCWGGCSGNFAPRPIRYGGITRDGASTAYLDKVDAACYPRIAGAPVMRWVEVNPAAQSADTNTKGKAVRLFL